MRDDIAPAIMDDDDDNRERAANDDRLAEVHERALSRFDAIASVTQEVRSLSLAARRFVSIPGAQWEGAWGEQFQNSIMVEINKVAAGLEKIVNDYRANRVTVGYRAVGNKGSEATAQTLEGLHRADAYHFKAQQARDNAFEEAAAGGFGAYRLTTDYADPTDPDDDAQRINPGMVIVDADQRVFFDLNSKLYDKSDADHCFVLTGMTRTSFETEYEEAATSWPEQLPKLFWDWFQPDMILVAEYYELEDKTETRLTLTMPVSGEERRYWDNELDTESRRTMLAQGWKITRRRRIKRARVHKYTMSGAEILSDDGIIAGDCIPVIPVYGKRWYIDNLERWRGHVQNAMDPARILNAQISKLVETASLSPRETPIFFPEQINNHATDWADANINRPPFLRIDPMIGPDGTPLPAGQAGVVKPPDLPPVLATLIQLSAGFIDELTNSQDGADEARSNVSAEAMEIAATRVDAKAATYMDNMRQSVQREGEVYIGMAREIYYEPGREVDTMDNDGGTDTTTLHQQVTQPNGSSQIVNDIARGKYNVISDVVEANSTRRDKTVRACLNLAQVSTAAQQLDIANAALLTAMASMDGDGIDGLQDWARQKMLAMGLAKPTDDEKRQMQEAAQNAPPDPNAAVAQAQAIALQAVAEKDHATAGKLVADTGLSHAKTVQTLADAHAKVHASPPVDHGAHDAFLRAVKTSADVHAAVSGAAVAAHKAGSERLKAAASLIAAQTPKGPLEAAQTL